MGKALFAAGCFWGVQYYFDQVPGVTQTTAGYTGGKTENPNYQQVCTGETGHAEAVLVEYDSEQITYEELLKHFFRLHDPTQLNRQGPDIGTQYRSAIFCYDETQKQQATAMIEQLAVAYELPLVTEVSTQKIFYPAEGYHQKFAQKTGRGQCHVDYQPLS